MSNLAQASVLAATSSQLPVNWYFDARIAEAEKAAIAVVLVAIGIGQEFSEILAEHGYSAYEGSWPTLYRKPLYRCSV